MLSTLATRVLARAGAFFVSMAILGLNADAGVPIPLGAFCFGDGSAGQCPCTPPQSGQIGRGCPNSFNAAGASLGATSTVGGNTLLFLANIGGNSAAFGLMLKGNGAYLPGSPNGDGLLCVGGQLVRFGGHNAGTYGAILGNWSYPNSVQTTSVSAATNQLPGQDAYYQLYYRNVAPNFCNPSTTNWSNAFGVAW